MIISLHFRIGDYKYLPNYHSIMSIEYYQNCIEYLIQQKY